MVVLWEQGSRDATVKPQLTRSSTTGRSTARRLYEILRLRNGTPPASRAHFLAEKGLTVATVQVDLRNGEQFSPGP